MGKLTTYLLGMTATIIIFYLFGLVQNTFSSMILDLLFNPTNLQNSALWIKIIGIGASAATFLITIYGVATKNDLLVVAPMIVVLLNFLADYLVVYNLVVSYTHWAVGLLFISPFMVLYMFTVIEWWRGITT